MSGRFSYARITWKRGQGQGVSSLPSCFLIRVANADITETIEYRNS